MSKHKKAWIYCRVMNKEASELLDYQYELLSHLIDEYDLLCIGVSSDVSDGFSFKTKRVQKMIEMIRCEEIDIVLAYSKNRLFVPNDLYEEFEMLCAMHHVEIITLKK